MEGRFLSLQSAGSRAGRGSNPPLAGALVLPLQANTEAAGLLASSLVEGCVLRPLKDLVRVFICLAMSYEGEDELAPYAH